jgi:hypothetical protein
MGSSAQVTKAGKAIGPAGRADGNRKRAGRWALFHCAEKSFAQAVFFFWF